MMMEQLGQKTICKHHNLGQKITSSLSSPLWNLEGIDLLNPSRFQSGYLAQMRGLTLSP